jgi:hypothetical protein
VDDAGRTIFVKLSEEQARFFKDYIRKDEQGS